MVNTYEAVLLTLLFAILAIQVSIALTVLPYVRLGRRLRIRMDEYVDALLLSEDATTLAQEQTHGVPPEKKQNLEHKRERLAALAIGGQARQYLGRSLAADSIDAMAAEDIEKLYTRYEARLGAMMTKTLGQAAIQLYASVVGSVLPIPPQNQSLLAKEPPPSETIRVTAEEPPPHTPMAPLTKSTRPKDPKKQAAGHLGAAARKAKQARLEEELT